MGDPEKKYAVDIIDLRALARAIGMDREIDVVAGPPGSGWRIDARTGEINADTGDLRRLPPDELRALLCHEVGHAALTRYAQLMPRELLARPGIGALMNALEDCRVETWLRVRYPGARSWLAQCRDRHFPRDAAGLAQAPWHQQFCLGAIHEWWHGELPACLDAQPRDALERTREARQAVVNAQPPYGPDVDLQLAMTHDRSRLAALFRWQDRFHPPSAFEKAVRLAAYHAYRHAWRDVRPVYEELVRADQARGVAPAPGRHGISDAASDRARGPAEKAGRQDGHAPALDLRPSSALLVTAPSSGEPGRVEALPAVVAARIARIVEPEPANHYEAAYRDIADLADRLVAHLERILGPSRYPRWVHGYPTGARIELGAAMGLEADPRAYTRIWSRKTLPLKHDPAFLLLLDLSGSMRGEPVHNCFRGTILVAEVLERMQIPFAVHGFQDVLIPFKRFDQPLDAAAREVIGEMPQEVTGSRPRGHNRPRDNWDGPVLRSACAELLAFPCRDPVLLCVSDGKPSGPDDAEAALHRAVAEVAPLVDLVGIGLGPDTEHVRRFYPQHLANVTLQAFPDLLGQVMERSLTQGLERRRTRRGGRA